MDEDGNMLQPAEPGRIMAHHYIALPTMVCAPQPPALLLCG